MRYAGPLTDIIPSEGFEPPDPDEPVGWTCPVCGFYCRRAWLICPACDFVRPADYPMDGEA